MHPSIGAWNIPYMVIAVLKDKYWMDFEPFNFLFAG